MDAARTAFRLSGINSKITIVYRRTISEMPADQGEIKAVIEEGMEIIELVAPIKIVSENGKVKSLLCVKMKLERKMLPEDQDLKSFQVLSLKFPVML